MHRNFVGMYTQSSHAFHITAYLKTSVNVLRKNVSQICNYRLAGALVNFRRCLNFMPDELVAVWYENCSQNIALVNAVEY